MNEMSISDALLIDAEWWVTGLSGENKVDFRLLDDVQKEYGIYSDNKGEWQSYLYCSDEETECFFALLVREAIKDDQHP